MKNAALSLIALSLALTTACSPYKLWEGKVINGLDGKPVANTKILAKAEEGADMTCQTDSGVTDAAGSFKLEKLCPDVKYTLEATDSNWLLGEVVTITGGAEAAAPTQLTIWQAPSNSGVYFLIDGKTESVRTYSDVKSATILNSDVKLRYPETLPKDDAGWTLVPSNATVIINGKGSVERLQWIPAAESPEVKFAPDREGITDWSLGGPWTYIGIRFTNQTTWEMLTATIDESKTKSVQGEGDRAARYFLPGALPDGKYALLGPEDRRTYLLRVDSTAPPVTPEAPAAPATEAPAAE